MRRRLFVGGGLTALTFTAAASFAAAQTAAQPRYSVDQQTGRAIGAKEAPADELKRQLDRRDGKTMVIDVREPAEFQKETLPGAVNIPLGQLEQALRTVPKDTALYFT